MAAGTLQAQEESGEPAASSVDEADLLLFPDEAEAAQEAEPVPSAVGIGDLIRVLAVLAGVVGAIYLLVYALRKVSPMSESDDEQIRLLSTRHLKRDSSLHLIEVGNQIFLIGSGTGNISLISEITDKETADQIRLKTPPQTAARVSGGFGDLVRRSLSLRRGTREGESRLADSSPDFLRNQRDRLKDLGGRE